MERVVTPQSAHGQDHATGYFIEYNYAKKTLDEALNQFKRKCDVIVQETEAVRHLMERSGDRQIISELTDTRKIHELNAEDRIKVEISPEQWSRLSISVGYMQVGATFAFGIVAFVGWLVDKLVGLPKEELQKLIDKINEFSWTENIYAFITAIALPITVIQYLRNRSMFPPVFLAAFVALVAFFVKLNTYGADTESVRSGLILIVSSVGFLFAYFSWSRAKKRAKASVGKNTEFYDNELDPEPPVTSDELCTSI
jgi:hypothetical protein